MNKLLSKLIILAAALALLTVGCSDDDDDTTGTGPDNGGTVPQVNFSDVIIDTPTSMTTAANNDPTGGAAMARNFLLQLNSVQTYSNWFSPPQTAFKPQDTLYSWSQGGLTVTLKFTETESVLAWEVTVDGNDGQTTYDNFTLIDGYRELADVNGSMSVYDKSSPNLAVVQWDWITEPTGVFVSQVFFNDDNTSVQGTVNPDGSGSVIHIVNQTTMFDAFWNAIGGTFTIYDSNGDPIDSGTWGTYNP